MTRTSGIKIQPLTVVLAVLGVVILLVAIVYFTKSANDLPSFFPGHQAGVTRHHTKHGLALVALAVVTWIGAWFTTATPAPPQR